MNDATATNGKGAELRQARIFAYVGWGLAFVGLALNSLMQVLAMNRQAELKRYEVTFLERRKAYTNYMVKLSNWFNDAFQAYGETGSLPRYQQQTSFVEGLRQFQLAFLDVEPLVDPDARKRLRGYGACMGKEVLDVWAANRKDEKDRLMVGWMQKREELGDYLFYQLFKDVMATEPPQPKYLCPDPALVQSPTIVPHLNAPSVPRTPP